MESDKLCNVSEYLDYKRCKGRQRFVDKLVVECTKIIEETSLVKINSTKCKHNSRVLYIVLFSTNFITNIGIPTYVFYYIYMNHNKENVCKYDYVYQSKNYYYKWNKLNK